MIVDANALSAWAEGNSSVEVLLLEAERLVIPSAALGEYFFGIRQSRKRKRHEEWLSQHLPPTEAAGSGMTDAYASIRLELKRSGCPSRQTTFGLPRSPVSTPWQY